MFGAKAKVNLTVEISVKGTWGEDCTVAQVHKQAKREALEIINGLQLRHLQVLGEPKVIAILAEAE